MKRDALPIAGVLFLDKPLGLSSNQALRRAQYLLHAAKAGHTGTLDPLATGLLPLCFGVATKFTHGLLHADKAYDATICLGIKTSTGDAGGEIISRGLVTCELAAVIGALQVFRGELQQMPPMYSALKKDGQPLYTYARAGQEVVRPTRKICIHELELIDFTSPILKVRVVCSKGTYIRTLAEDIGAYLGCGAHLIALRRTAIAGFKVQQAITLDEFSQLAPEQRVQKLAPPDALIQELNRIALSPDFAQRFLYGQRLRIDQTVPEGTVRVYADQRLLGTASFIDGVLRPQRLLHPAEL